LGNEISGELKTALAKNKIDYQLTPPHIHRRNTAERAIRTFKNHFLAGLASCNPKLSIAEWDRLIPQGVLTLNHLIHSRIKPNLSAFAYIYGIFDFNTTPLAPPGTRVVIHEKPSQRNSLIPRVKVPLKRMNKTTEHPAAHFIPTVPFPRVNHIYNEKTGKRETIDSLLNSPTRDVWIRALSNEWGRLAQGNNEGVIYQDAIDFIAKNNGDITYAQCL